jgi:glycosyltransferase involved in cell wall biosynthesis
MIEPAAAQPDSTYDPNRSFIMECGYIGSFYEGKGIEIVLQIANKMPDIRFHIVGGSKTQQDALRQTYQVGTNVIWYGYQPYNRTMEILDCFDIALLPNQKKVIVSGADIGSYTSPNKMFEYLSKGKIIVASDLDVLREILTDGENAILVASNDVDAWVEAIQNILTDEARQRKLSMNGYQMIKNRYNWKDRAGRVLDNLDIEERKS